MRTKKSEDEWIINFDRTKDIKIKGSNTEKFMKTCLEVCWKLQNRYKDVKFYWDIKKRPELFKQCGGSPQESGKLKVGRVYIPAVFKDKELPIRKGKYSFEPGNSDSNTREENDTGATNTCEKTDQREPKGVLKDKTAETRPTGVGTTDTDTSRATFVEGKAKSSGVGSAGKNEPSQRYPPRGSMAGPGPLISLPNTEENGGTAKKGKPRHPQNNPSTGSGTVVKNMDF